MLSDLSGQRPDGSSEESRMRSRNTALDPPHTLAIAWCEGAVSFALERQGDDVPDRARLLAFGTGRRLPT